MVQVVGAMNQIGLGLSSKYVPNGAKNRVSFLVVNNVIGKTKGEHYEKAVLEEKGNAYCLVFFSALNVYATANAGKSIC